MAVSSSIPRKALAWLPFAVAFVLLALLWERINWRFLLEILAEASLPLLLCALFLCFVNMGIGAFRWGMLLRHSNRNVLLLPLLRFMLESAGANLFIPGGIGGDAVRCVQVHREGWAGRDAFASVMTDRVLGLLGFLLLASFTALYQWLAKGETIFFLPLLGVAAILFSFCAILYSGRISSRCLALLRPLPAAHALGEKILAGLASFRHAEGLLFRAFLVALLTHSLQIIVTWLIGLAIHIDIGLLPFILYVPVTALLTALPVSHAGLGVRESGFILLFALAGVGKEQAMAMSLLFFFIGLVIPGLAGIFLFVATVKPKAAGKIAQE